MIFMSNNLHIQSKFLPTNEKSLLVNITIQHTNNLEEKMMNDNQIHHSLLFSCHIQPKSFTSNKIEIHITFPLHMKKQRFHEYNYPDIEGEDD